jgi:MerR family transcriptional regulator, thiopeptide resistance regulator
MKMYTTQQLTKISGVTSRTLRHYDAIGLLTPSFRNETNQRVYGESEALRLQQILFYKELDLPLVKIKQILEQPDFDLIKALEDQKNSLLHLKERLNKLILTIDKTILHLKQNTMLTDAQIYEGFPKEKIAQYKKEVAERYDPEIVKESYTKVRKMPKAKLIAIKAEMKDIAKQLAKLIDKDVAAADVQKVVAKHHVLIGNFYTVTPEIYRGLGLLYTTHPDFRANYDKYAPGLADFFKKAIDYFCDQELSKTKD